MVTAEIIQGDNGETMPLCETCNQPVQKSHHRFCSRGCLSVFHSKRLEGLRKPIFPCKVCGCLVNKHVNKFCSQHCYHEWRRGENVPTWKGGITKSLPEYNSSRWRKLRLRIRKRDNHECKICSANKLLCIHHIYPTLSYRHLFFEETNLVTLCTGCHRKVEGTGWERERVALPKFGEVV